MKKIFFIAVAALLAGCSQKPDPQVAELQKQVADLNRQVSSLLQEQKNIAAAFATAQVAQQLDLLSQEPAPSAAIDPQTGLPLTTNPVEILDPATGLPMTRDEVRLLKLEMQFSKLIRMINENAAIHPPIQSALPSVLPAGIPADVLAQIRAGTQKIFPGDFNMQNFLIQQQADAWLKLHGNK